MFQVLCFGDKLDVFNLCYRLPDTELFCRQAGKDVCLRAVGECDEGVVVGYSFFAQQVDVARVAVCHRAVGGNPLNEFVAFLAVVFNEFIL